MKQDAIILIEEYNLTIEDTGIAGIIRISSKYGKGHPRVKWYAKPPKSAISPYLAVSISAQPKIRNTHLLPDKIARSVEHHVKKWVILNHEALLDFWKNGQFWYFDKILTFIDDLKKISG